MQFLWTNRCQNCRISLAWRCQDGRCQNRPSFLASSCQKSGWKVPKRLTISEDVEGISLLKDQGQYRETCWNTRIFLNTCDNFGDNVETLASSSTSATMMLKQALLLQHKTIIQLFCPNRCQSCRISLSWSCQDGRCQICPSSRLQLSGITDGRC